MGNEMDRVKMANESLAQVKAKLEDELKSFKTEMDALKKRFADLDRDNRKVVHEREELARAYKKSDDEMAKHGADPSKMTPEDMDKAIEDARAARQSNKKNFFAKQNVARGHGQG